MVTVASSISGIVSRQRQLCQRSFFTENSKKVRRFSMKAVLASPPSLVLCLLTLYGGVQVARAYGDGWRGSTRHLRRIVLGRCWDYQVKKFGSAPQRWKNCTEICEAFYKAFAYKDPCELTFVDYKPYFDAVGMTENANKSLFWSGTYKAVHSYSDFDLRYTTLEDTMAGWIVNGLNWCGNKSLPRNTSDGIEYNSCPNCSQRMDAFWGQASELFAQKASGVVRVMVNGSRIQDGKPIPSYKNSSYFGKYELPAMNVTKVTKLQVIVVHTISGEKLERCGTKSVKLLDTLARKRGLKTGCVDDPLDVKHILCTDYPSAPECLFYGGNWKPAPSVDCRTWKTLGVIMSALVGLLLIVAGIMLVYLLCARKKKSRRDSSAAFTNL